MTNNYFQEYAQTKQLIESLNGKLKDLEPKLMEEVKKTEGPIKNDFGTFTKQVRKSYKFSKTFEGWLYAEKQTIAKKQKAEMDAGRAEITETESLRYISIKQNDK